MIVGAKMKALQKKLTAATAILGDEIASLRRDIEEKKKAIHHVRRSPLPVDELPLEECVEAAASWWLDRNGQSLVNGERALGRYERRGHLHGALPWSVFEPLPWAAYCASDAEAAQAFLRGLFDRVDFEPGPPSAERPELIASLEAELVELQESEELMIDESIAAGIMLEHRPEVSQRREQEARARELEERAVEDRERREAALEEEYAARRRRTSGHSPYLESLRQKDSFSE